MSVSQDWSDAIKTSLGSLADVPEGIEAFSNALFQRYHSAVRCRAEVDPQRLPFGVSQIDWYSLGYRSREFHSEDIGDSSKRRPSRTLQYAAGDFFLQDAGSMLALAACDADRPPNSDRLVCDLCAAPGGKASALLESIGGGFLLANEPIQSRVAPLAYNLARTGNGRYAISSQDPDRLAETLGGIFDLVVVDAPCSGQALLGKGKQSVAALSAKQIDHSASRARRILSAALRLLRPGGQLVLSTCTFAEAENEAQIQWLLEQSGVTAHPVQRLNDYQSSDLQCTYRLWPQRHQCAGSFAASVNVDLEANEGSVRRKPKREKAERLPKELEAWFGELPRRTKVGGAVIWGWPDDAPDWVEAIAAAGPELAYRTGQTWKPSHQAALRRTGTLQATSGFELDDSGARQFLSGQVVDCDRNGWSVARHQGRPLGWVKASRGSGKNHLPAAARMTIEA